MVVHQLFVVIQYISIVLLFVEAGYVFLNWRTRSQGVLFLYCAVTLVNSVGYLFQLTAQSRLEYIRSIQLSYLGRTFVPLVLFVFTMQLCKVNIKRRLYVILALYHSTIFWLVLTTEHHKLYYNDMTTVKRAGYVYVRTTPGMFHMINTALIIFYILFGVFKIFQTIYREKNPIIRKKLLLVAGAICAQSFFFILHTTMKSREYDLTQPGYALAAIFMGLAIFKYELLDVLQLMSDYIMDDVSEGFIVFDNCGNIEYSNSIAKKVFPRLIEDGEKIFNDLHEKFTQGDPLRLRGNVYSIKETDVIFKGYDYGKVISLIDETDEYKYVEELKEQKSIAEEANASKSAFLSVVSHEIRTPMNAVVGMTELLLADEANLNEKQIKYLKNIKNSGSSLVMIVNDILDQSKIEAGKMEIIEEPFEIKPMVEDISMIIENRIGSKPIALRYDISDNVPAKIMGDSLRIRQILINLMNNSVKFTEEGSITLSINCIKNEDGKCSICYSVKDTGQGIPPKELCRLGEAFTQIDTRINHNKEGTGLGISISKNFIALMGGQLQVSSEYGKGSEFFFTIVHDVINDEASNVNLARQAWQGAEVYTAPDAKILVVDDTEVNLMVTEELLAPLKMTIDTVSSGAKAIEMVCNNKYDLIFMDYMMPYMDGAEAAYRIRSLASSSECSDAQKEYYAKVPIVALSGDSSEKALERFKEVGINDFIEKPVVSAQLKAVVRKWISDELICVK